MLKIIRANGRHIDLITPLFDAYRVFYGQNSGNNASAFFIEERLKRNESIIFLALEKERPVGFTQLYRTFSSVSLQPFFILNDLYVDKKYRCKGIGAALLEHAKMHCTEMGSKGLALETAIDNPAQKLYEKLGWENDGSIKHYFWTAPKGT
ncbi:GNAT family N-acetyltransferase [Croceitalea sp. MTPC5]|uniref:GNAT family N-acetyltransferase n=1 Tax=Croceitalea sp. MTPC5 TaxID=3056565 RepID=UPI002B3F17F9|nr:GNAT family N-acetyltransferase [Croceitalea sp. MTPC5]